MTGKLSASILSADVTCLGEQMKIAERAGAEYIHIDIMDGVFVPNSSFGLIVAEGLRGSSDAFFDLHLMIVEPEKYIERFANAGADGITVHAEACKDLNAAVDMILATGKKAAVAISPDTDIDVLLPVLDKLYMVLVMTVYPGYGGQKIITATYDKIRRLRQIISQRGLNVDIEVDGGVSVETIPELKEAGANIFVVGTKVFKGDIEENIAGILKALES